METDRHHLRRHAGSRKGFSARTVAFSVLVVVTSACGLYLYMVPGVSANIPSSCNLSPSSLSENAQSCPAGLSPVSSMQPEAQAGPCSQEMVDLTSPGDTLFSLLHANLLDENASRTVASSLASEIAKSGGKPFDANTSLPTDKRYSVTIDQKGNFLRATLEIDPANVFHAAVEDCSIRCWKEEVVLDYKIEAVCFKMKGDLVDSVMNAGEGPELAMKLQNVFRWDIDFQSQAKRGDSCRILFERRYADDRPSGYGKILCAVYEGRDRDTKRKSAVSFMNGYYDTKGRELKKNSCGRL